MPKALTTEQVIALLRKRQGARQNKEIAAELGIAPSYYSDIIKGRRDPGETVLRAMGLKKAFVLEKAS